MVFGQDNHKGLLPPPPGVTPNFVNPETNVLTTNVVGAIFTVITTTLVLLRIYTRTRIVASWGWDDTICVLSWPFLIAFEGLFWGAQKWGYGRHMWDIPVAWNVMLFKVVFAGELMYIPLTTFMKLTYLLSYLRIFTLGRGRVAIWAGIVMLVTFQTVIFFVSLFYCTPIQGSWDHSLKAKCLPKDSASYATGVFNIFIDFYILILPMPMLFRLHVESFRKYKVIALFGVGIFACVSSILRFAYTIQELKSNDPTWASAVINTWSELEVNVALSCSCFIALPSFWNDRFPEGFGSVKRILSSIFSSQKSSRGRSEEETEPKYGNTEAPHISTMASVTPGKENYLQLHEMVDSAMTRGGTTHTHTMNNTDRERGSTAVSEATSASEEELKPPGTLREAHESQEALRRE